MAKNILIKKKLSEFTGFRSTIKLSIVNTEKLILKLRDNNLFKMSVGECGCYHILCTF